MRDTSVVLHEMVEAIEAARECCVGKSFEDFKNNRLARLAAERAIEILSEAARHLPSQVEARHPSVPWPKIKAIGNVLRHEYYRIAAKIIWDVVVVELHVVESALRAELSGERSITAIYKICRDAEWREATRSGYFMGSAVDLRDGFIHFSTAAQVAETANKHFAGQQDLVLVAVNADALGAALKWEPSRGGALFPHLYGRLPVSAALWVKPLPLDEAGRFVFPPDL